MKKQSKAPASETSAIAGVQPVTPKGPADPTYYAHLATDWTSPDWYSKHCHGNKFAIHAHDNLTPGPLICTIIVNPAMNAKSQLNVARLMAFAPDLWRLLRKASTQYLNEIDWLDDYSKVVEILWLSADVYPFGWPEPSSEEDGICPRNNAAVMDLLNDVMKGAK